MSYFVEFEHVFFNNMVLSTTTTITSVLMPLSRLAGVGNFCSNFLSQFLSFVRIFSSQAISFRILLYALFPQFLWSTFIPFLCYISFHNFTYLEIDVSTHDHHHTTADDFELSYPQSSQQHPSYHEEHQSTPYQPVSPHTSS